MSERVLLALIVGPLVAVSVVVGVWAVAGLLSVDWRTVATAAFVGIVVGAMAYAGLAWLLDEYAQAEDSK